MRFSLKMKMKMKSVALLNTLTHGLIALTSTFIGVCIGLLLIV